MPHIIHTDKQDLYTHIYMQWLEDDVIGYLNEWMKSVKTRKGFTAGQKKLMMLPDSTVEGIRVTGMINKN